MNQPAVKRVWKRVDGVLLLDKPIGLSSNTALQKARRLFSAAKAGHTGTLDPLATGLLPLCFGEATKFSADLLEADKTYEAEIVFGATTDTGDAEGEIVERKPVSFGASQLLLVLRQFRGAIEQIPPMYSALKRNGRPLYELARAGVEVERPSRNVIIHELSLLSWENECCRVRVTCSKGTYIRTLAEDIGAALGCGAHLKGLRRTAVGNLCLVESITLEQIEALGENERLTLLSPLDSLLKSLPMVELGNSAARRFAHGNPVQVEGAGVGASGKCRVYAEERLLGVGEITAGGVVSPRRLVAA